jgi:hypothetical protein
LIVYALHFAGVVLIALVLFPFYRLLGGPEAGRFPRGAIAAADLSRSLLVLGSFIVIVVAVLASRLLDAPAIDRRLAGLGARLVAIPILWFAGALAVITLALTFAFSVLVLGGKPNLIDAMVQLLHARFVAAGHLAGPANQFTEFWQLQNSLITPKGWVSQYPPGYVIFLAAGMRLGMVQLVGPFFAGMTVFFTSLSAERLLREDRVTARLGALMLCFSPFLIGLAGAFMNHVGAAAFTAAAIYCAVRSRDDGSLWWAALAGLAVGGVFSIRPLTAVVAALVVAVVWLIGNARESGRRIAGFLRRSLAATVGIAPIVVAIGAYNKHFFGSPFVFGYLAAQGPLVQPGFHRDPVGTVYGPLQALAYTSSDLVTLSLYLLETPIPVVLVVGLFLLLAKRFSVGARVIAVWALLPIVANALYWHHGIFMGPRMVNEAAPAWALLTAVAAIGLVRLIPAEKTWGNYSPRGALTVTFALSWLGGLVYLGPQRLASYGGAYMESSRIEIPREARPSLIFVHGAWEGRVTTRLVANGMRVDSLEAALRQNTTCDSHNYALWFSSSPADRPREAPPLDFSFVPNNPPPRIQIAAGDEIRARTGVPFSRECLREVASDTLGIVDVGPVLWQGDLPGIGSDGPMFVRDMGPEANARLIQRYPDRVPEMLLRPHENQPPKLMPYVEGMNLIWPAR